MSRFGGNQGAGELHFTEHRFGRYQNQELVEIGGKSFGANVILTVEDIAALEYFLDRAFIALTRWGRQPQHIIAHNCLAFFATRVADAALAVRCFDHAVATIAGNHQACLSISGCLGAGSLSLFCHRNQASFSSASMRRAQSISVSEMPPTSCVFRLTLQRL